MKINVAHTSVSLRIDFLDIRSKEKFPIELDCTGKDFSGSYKFYLYESKRKENKKDLSSLISVENGNIIIEVNPSENDISPSKYYYEIWDEQYSSGTERRVVFEGFLHIKL